MSKYGFYKVATGNILTRVGNVKENARLITLAIHNAFHEGVSVLTFGELSLTGYTAADLFFDKNLLDECKKQINLMIKNIPSGIIVFVGAPFEYLDKIYDVAFALTKNKVLGIIPKTHLPNYNEFYEKRWFSSSKDANFKEVIFNGKIVPFGSDLIFKLDDLMIGAEICEDLWVANPPSNNLCANGANLICNLSASNEIIGKREYRKELVKFQSAKNYCIYVYSSSGFGESSQDLVYSGHQIIAEEGKIIRESYDVKGLTVGLVDVDLIKHDREKYKTTFEYFENKSEIRLIDTKISNKNDFLPINVERYPFILKDDEKRKDRSLEIISLQAKALATRLFNIKCKKVVIGISGGLDSTLALLVCLEAYKILNFDIKNIYAFTLPGFGTSDQTYQNAKELIKLVGVSFNEIDIKKQSKDHLESLNHPLDQFDTTYENTQARIRTQILMDFANSINGIVIGTGDLSELALGFCTYNGDHMAMYNVNCSVPKTLVKYIIDDYSKKEKNLEPILQRIISTPISPELIPTKDGEISQKTEEIIGKYDLHDFFLFNYLRNGYSKKKIFALAQIAFAHIDVEYIRKTLDIFFKRFYASQFKRSCTPDGVKVGSVSLSPRGDLRLPSDLDL